MLVFVLSVVVSAIASFLIVYPLACWAQGVPPWPIRWFD